MSRALLLGKRILVTQAADFMGPTLCTVLDSHGAAVIPDYSDLSHPSAAADCIQAAGDVDVLVVNLSIRAPSTPAESADDEEWRGVFSSLVDPLPRLMRAVLPQMKQRSSGKILVMGSASALRGMKRASTYSAARGAQLAYAQAAGIELASMNIQVQSNPKFVQRLAREVPLGRLVSAEEDAQFAAYLCSDHADCFVGQVFPVCGGWVQR